jgi:glycosyltransferase involved in cell wall biosynthesis
MQPDLFIGMTTWNSATFLPHSLQGIRHTTDPARTRVVIMDNESTDATIPIARRFDAEVVRRHSGQGAALADLFNLSRSQYTLLIHADVVLLDGSWLERCTAHLNGQVAMVSPEDIGCGPYTRPWGRNMPESSFLLFHTTLARKIRIWQWRRRFTVRLPYRAVDFTGDHITYNLPLRLTQQGLTWKAMAVHTSSPVPAAIYTPHFNPTRWIPEYARFRYGLGNFYSLDGVVTHYHNWFERTLEDVPDDSERCLPIESGGLPLAFIKKYTMNFVDDLSRGTLEVPGAMDS